MLRRMRLSRLLLALAGALAAVAALAAIASALASGPIPKAKPLAVALHEALAGSHTVQGVTASVQFTNRLLEGASLAGGEEEGAGGSSGSLTSSPLVAGGKGRLWIGQKGQLRIELQSEQGDTELYVDGATVSLYDAASGTLYRYTAPQDEEGGEPAQGQEKIPTVAGIQRALNGLRRHVHVSEGEPADVAGRAAYTVHFAPLEGGSLLAGGSLSFDAENGTPLRAAIYATSSPEAVLELAAESISYGRVEGSIFAFTPPPGTKVVDVHAVAKPRVDYRPAAHRLKRTTVHVHGHGIAAIAEFVTAGAKPLQGLEKLPSTSVGSVQARELKTALGTILVFERGGARYILAGSDPAAKVQAAARGR